LSGLFVLAAVFGTIDILLFLRIREVKPSTAVEPRRPAAMITVASPRQPGLAGSLGFAARYLSAVVRQLLLDPLRDRALRRYVLYGATAMFAMAVGGPFYIRNMRENLGFSHLAINAMFMVLGPLMAIIAVKQWGKLIDRFGRRPMLMIATALAVFGVAPYFFASKYTPNPQFLCDAVNAAGGWIGRALARLAGLVGASVDWGRWQPLPPGAPVGAWLICSTTIFFGFVGWAGVMLGQQGIVLGFADGPGRSKYVAAHAVLTGMGGVVGGIVGGQVAEFVGQAAWYHPMRFGIFEWNNWHVTFALSMLARVLAVYLLIGMPDPGSRRARDMVRTISVEMYNLVAARLFFDWRDLLRTWRERRQQRKNNRHQAPPAV
jgi:MFS family permease